MKKAFLPNTENSINTILEHFFYINRKRMELTRNSLSTNQTDFIDILPMLFHCNHPRFPGYISQTTPCGIAQYNPMQQSLRVAKKLFKSFQHKRRAQFKMEIASLFFMGSSGSIAYTSKSDFDVWLIHEEGLSEDRLQELQQKAELIEEWAAELKLEVHFFIFDSASFRQGSLQSLSTESSGSSQHRLLLDEFYRSSLLIAGRYPLWWLVPPEQENNYHAYIENLLSKRFIDKKEVVDFGPVSPVPADEFFGAAIWQIYKGINSPYKSVMKLLLMETYASEHPNIQLLSTRYKELIYQNEKVLANLDPYIIMYRKIADYLMTQQDKQRLDTFRESFYLKINEKLSKKSKTTRQSARRKIFTDLMLEWGWEEFHYRKLDTNNDWRIDDIKEQRNKLTHVLTKSYQFLSNFARRNAEVYRISQSEINVLGRKLYAAFDKKNGKIEIINRGIAPNPIESKVTLVQNKNKQGQKQWLLFRERKSLEQLSQNAPLHRTIDLLSMLVWCHLNQIVTKETFILIHAQDQHISVSDIQKTLRTLNEIFPDGKRNTVDFDDLSHAAYIDKVAIFVNFSLDKDIHGARNEHVTSDRADPLSFGALHKNLAKSFSLLITSSWDEVLVYSYEELLGMQQMIADLINWSSNKDKLKDCDIKCFCNTASYGESISLRIEQLVKESINRLIDHQCRYVFSAEDRYYLFENANEKLSFEENLSFNQLLNYLQKPNHSPTQLYFDKKTEWNNVLPYLYALNETNVIQLFFMKKEQFIDIYIIDEKGSLFHQNVSFYYTETLIAHFEEFFTATHNRIKFMIGDFSVAEDIARYYYEIQTEKKQEPSINRYALNQDIEHNAYIDLKVIGSMSDEDKNQISIYCNNKEFSSLEYGNHVFNEVTDYVLSLRKGHQNYPIYITDIDFSSGVFNSIDPVELQTVHFLKYKRKIEENLNNALTRKSQSTA